MSLYYLNGLLLKTDEKYQQKGQISKEQSQNPGFRNLFMSSFPGPISRHANHSSLQRRCVTTGSRDGEGWLTPHSTITEKKGKWG